MDLPDERDEGERKSWRDLSWGDERSERARNGLKMLLLALIDRPARAVSVPLSFSYAQSWRNY